MMSPETQKQLKITDVSAKKLDKLNLHTAWDLVLHLPLRYEDETHIMPIKDAPIGVPCQVEGEVIHQEVTFKPRKQLIVQIADGSGSVLFLRFIHFYASHQKQTAVGKRIRAVGEIKHGFYGDEMIHPKIRDAEGGGLAESLTPVYPTVNGLNQPTLRRIIQTALDVTPLHDTLPDALLGRLKLPRLAESLRLLHSPPPSFTIHQLSDGTLPAWQRLKFDELLAQQLSMRLARQKRVSGTAAALRGDGTLTQALRQALPFALTDAQEKVVSEICRDMAQTHPMHRLLQGDVGSGKTIVAALSALTAIESGAQVAVMAPTEILAEQHFIKFKQWLEPLGIEVVCLFGSLRKKAKDEAKAKLADGSVKIAVGTHALFSDGVAFHNLGLSIVDEQHRFGVAQRLALKNKGREVHQLMMSATPIPRTLAMSFFADLDVSVIDELPPGRTPIKTRLVNNVRRAEVEGFVLGTCRKGRQAYWVCPLIEESETLQLQTAAETLARLQTALPEPNIGLVHGRMKACRKSRSHGGICRRPSERLGRHHRYRSRRRCAQCRPDGHRTRRAHGLGAASPITRTGRARRGGKRVRPPVCRTLGRTRQSAAESHLRTHRRLRNRPPRPQYPHPANFSARAKAACLCCASPSSKKTYTFWNKRAKPPRC